MTARSRRAVRGALVVALLSGREVGWAAPPAAARKLPSPAARLREYLRIDTSNPPGGEGAAALWVRGLLASAGIESEILEVAPGRASVYARLKGRTRGGGLLLHHHLDVVPAGPGWLGPAFEGRVVDGHLVGRGALDDKSLGVAQIEAFLALAATRRPPERDVALLATADEETGGRLGVSAVAASRPAWLEGLAVAVGEGGSSETVGGVQRFFGVEVAQKGAVWVRLAARGLAGHAAAPEGTSASGRVAQAAAALTTWRRPPDVSPLVGRALSAAASVRGPDEARRVSSLASRLAAGGDRELATLPPRLRNLVSDTVTITRIGSDAASANATPSAAWAEVDARLLPGRSAAEFREALEARVRPFGVEVSVLLEAEAGGASPEGPFFDLVATVLRERFPGAAVGPEVSTGLSENRVLRARGIATYGVTPFSVFPFDRQGVHGPGEKIRIDRFLQGVRALTALVERWARAPEGAARD